MTIKELAFNTQHYLQAVTGVPFKRSHIYELLAASFGFKSYAAFSSDALFATVSPAIQRTLKYDNALIKNRCHVLGYDTKTTDLVASSLSQYLTEQKICAIRIQELILCLRDEWDDEDEYEWDDEDEDGEEPREYVPSLDHEALISPLLIDGLNHAANQGNSSAHYALALIYDANDNDDLEQKEVGCDYWYQQAQGGRELTGVEKEWADEYEARHTRKQLFERHLKEAARLGHSDALLDLADCFDDPAFFDQATTDVHTDPARVAEIAERLGKHEDCQKWLTIAAESGDTEAMRRLIEEFDHGNLIRCWTWLYLAEMVGSDLTKDEYHAIHEDGSPYDDDVGGPIFVDVLLFR